VSGKGRHVGPGQAQGIGRRRSANYRAVRNRWLRQSEVPSLGISDILSVTKAYKDGVIVQPSGGLTDSEAPLYFLYGEPTLEQAVRRTAAGEAAMTSAQISCDLRRPRRTLGSSSIR
jgi:hypothetical protein